MDLIWKENLWLFIRGFKTPVVEKASTGVGIEPTTFGLVLERSTNWAKILKSQQSHRNQAQNSESQRF